MQKEMESDRILLRPWRESDAGTLFKYASDPASGRVMAKCGFTDTGSEVLCPNLEIGSDSPVRVLRLDPQP